MLRRAEPENVAFRNSLIRLSLLTGQEADDPHRLADSLLGENPGHPEVAATGALSLLLRHKSKEALALLSALKTEQLQDPLIAFYYGLVLTANGQPEKAREYLRAARAKPLLPEEESLLAKFTSPSAAQAAP